MTDSKLIKSEGKDEWYSDVYECPHCGQRIMEANYCHDCGESLEGWTFVSED